MARLVFGMNQSLDGHVDHTAFAPSRTLFRHFIEEAQGAGGEAVSTVAKCMRSCVTGTTTSGDGRVRRHGHYAETVRDIFTTVSTDRPLRDTFLG